jgi:putative heme iron utilization protein
MWIEYPQEANEMAMDAKLSSHINKRIAKLNNELAKETDKAKKAKIEQEIKQLEADKLK